MTGVTYGLLEGSLLGGEDGLTVGVYDEIRGSLWLYRTNWTGWNDILIVGLEVGFALGETMFEKLDVGILDEGWSVGLFVGVFEGLLDGILLGGEDGLTVGVYDEIRGSLWLYRTNWTGWNDILIVGLEVGFELGEAMFEKLDVGILDEGWSVAGVLVIGLIVGETDGMLEGANDEINGSLWV